MEKDFHFYCAAVLARTAGFSSREALTIAYASQYVDDKYSGSLFPRSINGVQLVHIGFEPVSSIIKLECEIINWNELKKNLIPFHFLPSTPFDVNNPGKFSFITQSDSNCARRLLDNAVSNVNSEHLLCSIGFAIHTYADTWSHAGFSGMKDEQNNVHDIEVRVNADDTWASLITNILPAIGHLKVLTLPDIPFMYWKCDKEPQSIDRDNKKEFLAAAQKIYNFLVRPAIPKTTEPFHWKGQELTTIPWDILGPNITMMFLHQQVRLLDGLISHIHLLYEIITENLTHRCNEWENAFNEIFSEPYNYDTFKSANFNSIRDQLETAASEQRNFVQNVLKIPID